MGEIIQFPECIAEARELSKKYNLSLEDILEMEEAMLTSLGYRTTSAATGKEALALYEADLDAYDLILTDQVMPEMKGSELAEILLTITPDLPLVFCTGFSESSQPFWTKTTLKSQPLAQPLPGEISVWG